MKLDKRLKKTINKLVKISFKESGKIDEQNTMICLKCLKDLPGSKIIPAMHEYLQGLKREIQKTTLEISSAIKLSEEYVSQITKAIRQESMVNQVETNLDSSLLGGFRIKIGDLVYDDSVSQRIKQLKGTISG